MATPEAGSEATVSGTTGVNHEHAVPAGEGATPAILQGLQPPKDLDLAAKQKSENWKLYKQQWQNYEIVAQLHSQTKEYKVALFLYSIGQSAVKIYNSFNLTSDERKELKHIMNAFDKYAIGEINETFERYLFNSRAQKEGESIDKYVANLRTLAKTCNFCTCLHDSLIKDRIVLGIRDTNTQKRLLRQRKLTLEECINICRSNEATTSQMKSMEQSLQIDEIHKVGDRSKRQSFTKNRAGNTRKDERERKPTSQREWRDKSCYFCGKNHKPGKDSCPAWGKDCKICGKKNHFAKQCKQEKKYKHKAHAIKDRESSDDSDYISTISDIPEEINSVANPKRSREIFAEMRLRGKPVRFHIDCGATVNVLPEEYVLSEEINPTKRVLQMWNKTEVKPLGICRLTIRNPQNMKKYSIEFIVVKENLTPLLGSKAIQHMGLIEVHSENFKQISLLSDTGITDARKTAKQIIEEFKDVFEGDVGTLEGEQTLKVDPTVTPTVSPSRRVPFAIKPKLQAELERLTALGVLKIVEEPTEWVSNMVIATKPTGDLRICIDPHQLNKALLRERYTLPVMDDVLPNLVKARVFTKVDARNGYWHVVLDEEASKLTTFSTPFGRYRWTRLPFGTTVSSEIFEKKLNQALDRLDGVLLIHDDMVVYGSGDSEDEAVQDHDKNLEALLTRCRDRGIKLNKKKLKLKCKEIPYMGHVITDKGLRADPEKVDAIINMTKPDNVKAVRRFCGFVNYLAKFLPMLTDVLEPLRRLTHQDVEWQWSHEHDKAFEQIKSMVTTAPILKYYNPDIELTVQCDASESGIGAALLQNGQPIAFASRAMTEVETRYAQIEKEMLAVVFSLQKFDQYVYGRSITVESDHKPLETIATKPLRSAPKRLQGMLLKAQRYDFKIVYKPGHLMYLADTLSRAYINCSENTQGEFETINAASSIPLPEDKRTEIRQATDADLTLQELKKVILRGWPEERSHLTLILTPYFSFRDELSVYDGLVYRGERLVIPKSMRFKMKQDLHNSHIGTNGCLRRARECLFWPGMNAELKEFIAQCEVCRKFETKQPKETLVSQKPAERPWERIGADIYTIYSKNYLIVVDYYSNFWEVDLLKDLKSSTTIKKMKAHFARYGIPDVAITDNGTQFTSEKFATFSKEWKFEHRTSSPGHQQANGKAEAAVKMVKRLLRKAAEDGSDPYLAILAHRNTPTEEMDSSPAQRLMGRRTKTLLPTTMKLLEPKSVSTEKVFRQTNKKQSRQSYYYNKGAKDLEALDEGDVVRMRPFTLGKKHWDKAVVGRRLDDRSYEVETEDTVYRRNRVDLKKTSEKPPETPEDNVAEIPETATMQPALVKPTAVESATVETETKPVRPRRVVKEPTYLKDYVRTVF